MRRPKQRCTDFLANARRECFEVLSGKLARPVPRGVHEVCGTSRSSKVIVASPEQLFRDAKLAIGGKDHEVTTSAG